MEKAHAAKLQAFMECVRILNDRRYKTERRVQACAAIAAFPIDELERAFEAVDPVEAGWLADSG